MWAAAAGGGAGGGEPSVSGSWWGGDARGSLDGQLDRLGRSAQVNGWN